jgi:spore maturation protein CgeB
MSEGTAVRQAPRRTILYVADPAPGTTSAHRLASLRRLGQTVTVFNTGLYASRQPLVAAIRSRFPVAPLVRRINRDLLRAVEKQKPDVVWFEKPTAFTPATVEAIDQLGSMTICYNLDNPFGPRNDGCWYQFKRAFRHFQLHCVPRTVDVARYGAWGVPYVKILLSYEPSMHFAPAVGWSEADRDREISYIGHPYEERPRFLMSLAEDHCLPISLSGNAWREVLSAQQFDQHVVSGFLADDAYREGIWKSKINLSFITRLNEEDIAHKAVEIAACQGFLLAIRTPGHQEIFEEDREAVFFSSVEECADKCRFYLPRPDLREAIARRGRERAVRSGYDNDTQLRLVLDRLDGRA